MEWQLFEEILVLMGATVAALVLSQRVRLPPSLGYLLVGTLVGLHALGLISEVAAIYRPDLLVIGARGRSPWLGLTLGSVSLAATQRATCPVLVVK